MIHLPNADTPLREEETVAAKYTPRAKFLQFSPPLISEEDIAEVIDTLRSNWLTAGPKTRKFEAEFATRYSAPGALALNSCTAGLHVALTTLGVGRGDEVITTPHTFCATCNVIEHVGATPVLVDIEPDTMNIDPAKIAGALTQNTKAILPVHFAGHPADMDPIRAIAEETGLNVIEDAAHAVHAKYGGRWIGSSDNPVSFSFYATKNLTTGQGGMLTGAEAFLEEARIVSLHGMSRDAYMRFEEGGGANYQVTRPGFNYAMTDILAAIGFWQLHHLEFYQARRRAIVEAYQRAFRGHRGLELPVERSNVESAWHLFVLRLNLDAITISRDRVIDELTHRNIGVSVHYIPIFRHPFYRDKYGLRETDYPVA